MAELGQPPSASPLDPKLQSALVQAATSLQREARRILRKHPDRLSQDVAQDLRACVAAIDTARSKDDREGVAIEAQRLDELLQRHAGFARKSSLREVLENIGFAVAVALGLRAVLYEPFNIPSGSMFPTLQTGDHIFVNKFRHGVQIPFTNTIFLEDLLQPIARGEVIVFRFPLDEADDYIKRVIGLPGDTLKFHGDNIWLKRSKAANFELISRKKLDRRCRDEDDPSREINSCDLYAETIDDHTYTVRYMRDPGISYHSDERVLVVPERSYLVLGDNRRRSKDSLMWMVSAPAVSASALLPVKDLRDLSAEREFEVVGGSLSGDVVVTADGSQDSITYRAKHESPGHRRELALWRKPLHGGAATFAALSRVLGELRPLRAATMGGLLQDDPSADARLMERAKTLGMGIDRLEVAEASESFDVLAYLAPVDVVVHLRCGKLACPTTTALGLALADVLANLHQRPDAPATELLALPKAPAYAVTTDPPRSRIGGRFWQTRLHLDAAGAANDKPNEAAEVRAFAVRGSFEGTRVLQEAALASAHSDSQRASTLADVAGRAFVVEDAQVWHLVLAQESQNVFVHVHCGKKICQDLGAAQALARKVSSRLAAASDQAHHLRDILVVSDFNGVSEVRELPPAVYPWDHVSAQATLSDATFEANLNVHLRPTQGLAALLASWSAQAQQVKNQASLGAGAYVAPTADGFEIAMARSDAAIRLRCGRGLCANEDAAVTLGQRIFNNAANSTNFVREDAMVPRPFVPRGNIKGRAEMIWRPLSRFGTTIE